MYRTLFNPVIFPASTEIPQAGFPSQKVSRNSKRSLLPSRRLTNNQSQRSEILPPLSYKPSPLIPQFKPWPNYSVSANSLFFPHIPKRAYSAPSNNDTLMQKNKLDKHKTNKDRDNLSSMDKMILRRSVSLIRKLIKDGRITSAEQIQRQLLQNLIVQCIINTSLASLPSYGWQTPEKSTLESHGLNRKQVCAIESRANSRSSTSTFNTDQLLALKMYDKYGLKEQHFLDLQLPGEFGMWHACALGRLLKDRGATPEEAIKELQGLTGAQARAIECGVSRDSPAINFNSMQCLSLELYSKYGLTEQHLLDLKLPGEFGLCHQCALGSLLRERGDSPEEAIKKLQGLTSDQATALEDNIRSPQFRR